MSDPPEVEFSLRAYCKMVLHAAKYPHCAVNGVLLTKVGLISSLSGINGFKPGDLYQPLAQKYPWCDDFFTALVVGKM